jgi:hypothetical protein
MDAPRLLTMAAHDARCHKACFSHSGAARTPPPALRSSLSAHRPRGPSDGQVKVGTQPGEGLPMAPPIFKTICETSFTSESAIFGKYACSADPVSAQGAWSDPEQVRSAGFGALVSKTGRSSWNGRTRESNNRLRGMRNGLRGS